MRHADGLLRRVRLLRLPIAAIMITAIISASLLAATAFAENPLYCNETVGLNVGCEGPHGEIRDNEGRNESGGCIAIQMWASGYGYSSPIYECGGNSIGEELTVHVESFPKCWNHSNATDTIHCRYSLWST
jgi:hypothetical protein